MVGLKTHSKVVLIVRDDGDRLRRYCHVGTGNYNSKTARIYEDLGILTCDDVDRRRCGAAVQPSDRLQPYRPVQVAPRRAARPASSARRPDRARGVVRRRRPHRPEVQCASPTTRSSMRSTRRAKPGTRIDLLVRGVCCLRAGVPGMSDNIRVRSVLGRYLEHSRIYRFGHGNVVDGARVDGAQADALHLIGSADLMPRNLYTAGRGAGAHRASAPHRVARPGAGIRAGRRRGAPGNCSPTTAGNASARSMRSPRIRRNGCTAGPSNSNSPDACSDARIGPSDIGPIRAQFASGTATVHLSFMSDGGAVHLASLRCPLSIGSTPGDIREHT